MSVHVGEEIGDYRIVSMIGAGSMGRVFQAEHRITKRKEALKVLNADCATENQIQRFQREIEVQAWLDHPNIARVHNAMYFESSLILVMEYVEGESLEKVLRSGKPARAAALDYIRQTLEALEYAHQRGVVHRDVNPSNLIIQNGTVRLTDFGLAKSVGDYQLTNAADIVGSLYYMAPEQMRRHCDPDPRSDIYAAGAVLYEALTGRKLFDCSSRLSLMLAQVEQQPIAPAEIDPSIGSELSSVVMRALAKDPAERYQSAREFLNALQPFRASPSIRRRFRKIPSAAAVVSAFALALTGGMARPRTPPSSSGLPKPALVHPAPPPIAFESVAISVPKSHIKVRRRPAVLLARPAAEPEQAVIPLPQNKKGLWSKLNPFRRKKVSQDSH